MQEAVRYLVLFIIVLFFMWLFRYIVSSVTCDATGSAMKMPSYYGVFTGCMIKPKDNWVPLANYREM